MKTKTVWNKHTGMAEVAQESPLEPGVFLYPKGTTEVPPPALKEGEAAVWENGNWAAKPDYRGRWYWHYDEEGNPVPGVVKEIGPLPDGASFDQLPEKPLTYEEQLERVETNRRSAYQEEADPLFFSWQRGEATEQEWIAKIAEIKKRFPKPEVVA